MRCQGQLFRCLRWGVCALCSGARCWAVLLAWPCLGTGFLSTSADAAVWSPGLGSLHSCVAQLALGERQV